MENDSVNYSKRPLLKLSMMYENSKTCIAANIHDWQSRWKSILIRFVIYVIGVYLFGMSIALYLYTRVGVSFIDMESYALLATFFGIISDNANNAMGAIPNDVLRDHYAYILLMIYVVMLVIVFLIRVVNTVFAYRKTHRLSVIVGAFINTCFDAAMMFLWSQFVNLNVVYLNDFTSNLGENMFIRTWVLLLSFLIFCISLSMTVFANMLYGPYNGLSSEFFILTKWNYKMIRVIFDVLIMIIGVLIVIFGRWGWDIKFGFFTQYFGFGTVFFTFIAGPTIGIFVKIWTKIIPLSKIDSIKLARHHA